MATVVRRAVGFLALAGMGLLSGPPAPASASNWSTTVGAGSSGEAESTSLPAPPTGAAAVCTSSSANTIIVTWSAVAGASTYAVYDATVAASGPYTAVATGVAATSWTTGGLSTGNYWFEVTAYVGTNWQSVPSNATVESTVYHKGPTKTCAQP